MGKSNRKSGQFTAPGDRLGVIEEFMPGSGTYVEEGTIHSKTVGYTLLDMLNRKVSVYPLSQAVNVPKVGSIVIGQVSDTKSKTASLRIFQIGKKMLSGVFSGILYISDASASYVDSMFDVCKTGDIVKAKIISKANRTLHLSTAESDFGVVYAFCSQCGHMLSLKTRKMQCPQCGRIENRKISSDYGKEDM
jgi:exosome complex component CSL4